MPLSILSIALIEIVNMFCYKIRLIILLPLLHAALLLLTYFSQVISCSS